MSTSIKQKQKKRNWAFIAYPESVPEDWLEILQKTGLPVAISPLHDKDIDPDGKPKKPHWHIILAYSGPQTYNAVKNLTDTLNAPSPEPLDQIKGYYLYFTHRNNPDKYQYDEKDIRTLNGFSILDWIELTKSEVLKIKNNLRVLIKSINLFEYADFVDWIAENGTQEEFEVACNNTYFFDKYLTSRRHQVEKEIK